MHACVEHAAQAEGGHGLAAWQQPRRVALGVRVTFVALHVPLWVRGHCTALRPTARCSVCCLPPPPPPTLATAGCS